MKKLVLILAFSIAVPLVSIGQSISNPFMSDYKKYENIITSIKKKETKKNRKYEHLSYKEKNKRGYKNPSPFTFARRKAKTPQNSYSYNW